MFSRAKFRYYEVRKKTTLSGENEGLEPFLRRKMFEHRLFCKTMGIKMLFMDFLEEACPDIDRKGEKLRAMGLSLKLCLFLAVWTLCLLIIFLIFRYP
ncbi:hypothetical protein DWU89_00720 [Parabacteroides acidifaciens]|uniref:Uncharacterized protein n=1 Tax=Parabacteroides acidifaciens TaxID=2290935 RepID=A0A3D8HJP9_9BACT|nr:hypothetical protein DWU89_00720 [Parabacteroides acidifaciens]